VGSQSVDQLISWQFGSQSVDQLISWQLISHQLVDQLAVDQSSVFG
jgi:hypothetical protein